MLSKVKRFIRNKLGILRYDLNYLKKCGAKVGDNVHISPPIYFEPFEAKLIEINDWVTIAPHVLFICHDSSAISVFIDEHLKTKFGRIIVKNNVYIGARATIMPGIEIGEFSIVGAMTLVNKSIEPYSVVVGVPGKKIMDSREFLEKFKSKMNDDNHNWFYLDWGYSLYNLCKKYNRNSKEYSDYIIKKLDQEITKFLYEIR
jgi:maltose O-acetyltransferase